MLLTADEDRRLAVLHSYGVLDTPREPEFDRHAQLLAHVCETPIALVGRATVSLMQAAAAPGAAQRVAGSRW